MRYSRVKVLSIVSLAPRWLLVLCGLPAVAASKVDFARDVQPILHARCASCHGTADPQGGLSVYTRAGLLKGGLSGPAVVPGNSRNTLLVQRVSGAKPPRMPLSGTALNQSEIAILRAWIDQGAEWPAASPTGSPAAPLELRRTSPPPGSLPNPIDAYIDDYFRRRGLAWPEPVSNAVFLRRAYLDLWGLLPTPAQRAAFLADSSPSARQRLVDSLLSDATNYAEHWISYWNDLLHNDEGVSYPAGKRESITQWLLAALKDNLRYDRMVQELLNPVGKAAPKGFLIGVSWGGDASASQSPPMQAAQNSAQVFLGAMLKCASCHDSFVSRWKLSETFGLAAFFSDEPLEIVRCDVKTGEKAVPRFLFHELTKAPHAASPEERRAQAAHLFTSPRNGRFARTIVNRIWKQMFGRGLVEPADDMDLPAWHPELLEWLAADFVDHGYDLHHLLRRIMTSRAYQLPVASEPAFRGPVRRRLTAEQFADAVSSITGEWKILDDKKGNPGVFAREWRFKSTPLTRALGRPDRNQVFTERSAEATTLQALEIANGEEMAAILSRGARRMLAQQKPAPQNLFDSGVLAAEKAPVDIDLKGAERLWLLATDAGSYGSALVAAGWMQAEFLGPQGSVKLAGLPVPDGAAIGPIRVKGEAPRDALTVRLPSEMVYDIAGKGYTRFRALVGMDEKSLRPEISAKVRYFVFSERPNHDSLIRVAGETPVPTPVPQRDSASLVTGLYRHALSREPTALELKQGKEFIDNEGADGLEDLLWIVFLSPEFQLIR